VADLFGEENGMPEQECACSVELGAAHSDEHFLETCCQTPPLTCSHWTSLSYTV